MRKIAAAMAIRIQYVYDVLARCGIPKRRDFSRERAARVVEACDRGVGITEAANYFGVSTSTATRRIRECRTNGRTLIVRRGRPRHGAPTIEQPLVNVDNPEVEAIYEHLRWLPFPYPRAAKDTGVVERVRAVVLQLVDGMIMPHSLVGVRFCAAFFPNRYEAASKWSLSALAAWRDPNALKRAIQFQLAHGRGITPRQVMLALTMRCRTPTIFKPLVARAIYERYCKVGDRVWDPCAGYGGRLLGAAAAGVVYVGSDVDERTVEGNRRLARSVGFDQATIHCTPAEDFNPPAVRFIFTSPPYFDRERYSRNDDQSWKKHGGSLEAWLAGFLHPVVERARAALPSGGYFALNVADLRERGKTVPLVDRTIGVALECGFLHVETLRMPIVSINRSVDSEPILVFQRPRNTD